MMPSSAVDDNPLCCSVDMIALEEKSAPMEVVTTQVIIEC